MNKRTQAIHRVYETAVQHFMAAFERHLTAHCKEHHDFNACSAWEREVRNWRDKQLGASPDPVASRLVGREASVLIMDDLYDGPPVGDIDRTPNPWWRSSVELGGGGTARRADGLVNQLDAEFKLSISKARK